MSDTYTTLYRWQWFQLDQWRRDFRKWKAQSPTAFKRVLADDGSKLALDCSCGLGLKTIVMKELGLRVWGSDACGFAVEKARELAALEGLEIEYFVSTWAELPTRTELRFDAVFNDALCWLLTDEQFLQAIRGIRHVLVPGGIFVWMGAAEGDPPGKGAELLKEKFESTERFSLDWTHSAGGVACTALTVRQLGEDFMDEHRLFLIDDAGGRRLETASIRQPAWWDWPRVERLFRRAGYSDLRTETFEGLGPHGAALKLNVAAR